MPDKSILILILTPEHAEQLNRWAKNNQDITSDDIIKSEFYRLMQNHELCGATKTNKIILTPEALVLLAKIAAKSTSITKLLTLGQDFGDKSEDFAESLTNSTSLTHLSCTLIENIEPFATLIAKCQHLVFLSTTYSENEFNHNDGLILAKKLIDAPSLSIVHPYQDLYDQSILQKAWLEIINDALGDYLPNDIINNIVKSYTNLDKEEIYTPIETARILNPYLKNTEIDIIVEYLGESVDPEL